MQVRRLGLVRTREQRRRLLRVVACVSFAVAANVPARADLLFYASFDETLNADLAGGSPTGVVRRRGLALVPDGKWGRAVRGQASSQLAYDVVGNLGLDRGTIEFFAKFEPFGEGQWKYSLVHVSGVQGMELGVTRQGRSAGIVLGWKIGRHTSWVSNAQRFLYYGTWQHYAITWDLTAGLGKGVFSVFVGGARRIHATDVDPFAWSPDQLSPGSSYTGASIDDLAIYDDVRYVEGFQPRQKPLARVAFAEKPTGRGTSSSPQKPFGQPSLTNPDFEDWQDGKPVGWNPNGNTALERDESYRFSGTSSLVIKTAKFTEVYPQRGITSEPVALEPNRNHQLGAWVSTPQSSVGDLRLEVRASDGRTVGSYSSGWSSSHGWLPINVSFRTNDSRQYTVHIFLRRHKNDFWSLMWLDKVRLEMNGESDPVLSEDDTARGFYLFSRSVMETSRFEKRMPSRGERIDRLAIHMSRGEYEPAFVGLHALRGLEDVDLRLTGDLIGPSGARLNSAAASVRRVQGALLPLTRPRGVDRLEMLAWWVTMKTTAQTLPGKYAGTLQVTVAGKAVAEIPLQIHVMDVLLPAPRAAFLVYHHEAYFADQFLTPELRRAYYRDMVAHGMNTVTVYNNADVDGSRIDFAHNTGYTADNPRHAYGLDTTMQMIRDSGLCPSGQPVLWLTNRPGAYGWGGVPETTLKAMLAEWHKRKWPEPLFYATDEPGGTGPRAAAAKNMLTKIKSWGMPVRTTTAGLSPEVLGKYFDVWIQGEGAVSQKTVQQAEELNAEVWTYTCHGVNQNMSFARALYGFWAAKTGVKGVASWAYYDNKRWTADDNGNAYGDPFTRLSQICVSPQGPIPTLSWEAIREGVDDYRYLQYLRDLLVKADAVAKTLSARSEEFLTRDGRKTIDQRELQRRYRSVERNPQTAVIRWKADNAQQEKAERDYLVACKLDEAFKLVTREVDGMLQAIPFDAMATRHTLTQLGRWSTYAPPLGPMTDGENPHTTTEDHRRRIVSYVLFLQNVLSGHPLGDGG